MIYRFSLRTVQVLALVLSVGSLLSCGDDSQLSSISVTPANTTIAVGATQQFTATAHYSKSSDQDVTSLATWSSGSSNIASVNNTGLATGVAAGDAQINASFTKGSMTASGGATLTVQ